MDKLSSNVYLNLIAIISAIAFVKMRIRNNIRDQEVIFFSLRIEKKIVFSQLLFIIAAVEGIAKLFNYRISLEKIVGNFYWITFAVLFFIVSGRKIVLTNNGVAYRYWLGNLNYIFRWGNVQSYYILPSEKRYKNKITVSYMNDRFRIKRFRLSIKSKYKKKLQNIFIEYVVEDNKLSEEKITIEN